jgi:hypothetical protein
LSLSIYKRSIFVWNSDIFRSIFCVKKIRSLLSKWHARPKWHARALSLYMLISLYWFISIFYLWNISKVEYVHLCYRLLTGSYTHTGTSAQSTAHGSQAQHNHGLAPSVQRGRAAAHSSLLAQPDRCHRFTDILTTAFASDDLDPRTIHRAGYKNGRSLSTGLIVH